MDPRTADMVGIYKGEAWIHGPPIWSEFKKGKAWIGQNFKSRIHGPLNRSEFLKVMQESTDRRIGPNYKSTIHGPLNRSEFLKGMQQRKFCLLTRNEI